MGRFYPSAAAWLKQREFDMWVPAFYHPHMPKDMMYNKPERLPVINPYKMVPTKKRCPLPFYQPIDENQMQRVAYSSEVMIEMVQKKVEFELVDEKDVVEMFDGLDRYLLTLQQNIADGDEECISYAKLVVKWRTELYKHYYRYLMLHPEVLESLYPNNSVTENMMHLMGRIGTGAKGSTGKFNPLVARANPPFDIDKTQPKDPTDQTEFDDGNMILGSSQKGIKEDDASQWNFNDFLSKGK